MSSFSALRTGLLCFGMFAFAAAASAQLKVAIVNLQKAVLDCDEIKKASADMEAKYKPRQMAAQKIETELQGIQQQLQNGQGKLTPRLKLIYRPPEPAASANFSTCRTICKPM